MSQPAVKRTFYDEPTEAELARWPAVTWSREVRGKHYALVLTYRGQSRFVTYPASPSNKRGALNHIQNIRAELRGLGATRLEVVKTKTPHRQRNRTEPSRVDLGEMVIDGPSRDPWSVLASIRVPDRAAMVNTQARIHALFDRVFHGGR